MNVRTLVAVAVVWILSLVSVTVWAQGNPTGSDWKVVTKDGQALPGLPPGARLGDVITGENIGFRVTRDSKGQILGRIVVKIDSQWRDVTFDVGITR